MRPRPQAPDSAAADTDHDRPDALTHHELNHVPRRGAERQAHADLVRTLRDQVADHAVHAEAGEQAREHGEQPDEPGAQAGLRHRARQHLFQRARLVERHGWIHLPQFRARRRGESRGRTGVRTTSVIV